MTVFCFTCQKTFPASSPQGGAVIKCPKCGVMYLVLNDGSTLIPRLFKLTHTKSHIVGEPESPSKIVKPAQQRLIVTPNEAIAEARRQR